MGIRHEGIFQRMNYEWLTGIWKKCSGLLAFRDLQIKTKMSFYLTPVRRVFILPPPATPSPKYAAENIKVLAYTVVGTVN